MGILRFVTKPCRKRKVREWYASFVEEQDRLIMKSPEKVAARQDEERRLERERQNEALESRVAREEQQRVRADFIVRALKEMAYSSEPAEDIKINKDYFKMLAGH